MRVNTMFEEQILKTSGSGCEIAKGALVIPDYQKMAPKYTYQSDLFCGVQDFAGETERLL